MFWEREENPMLILWEEEEDDEILMTIYRSEHGRKDNPDRRSRLDST